MSNGIQYQFFGCKDLIKWVKICWEWWEGTEKNIWIDRNKKYKNQWVSLLTGFGECWNEG